MESILALTFIGMISGLCGGFVGAGSEILIVPLLTIFGIYDSIKTSVGTSLVMILPPIGIFAVMKYYQKGYVDIYGGLYMALVFTIFSYISAKYSIHMNEFIFKKVFAVITILMGVYLFCHDTLPDETVIV